MSGQCEGGEEVEPYRGDGAVSGGAGMCVLPVVEFGQDVRAGVHAEVFRAGDGSFDLNVEAR